MILAFLSIFPIPKIQFLTFPESSFESLSLPPAALCLSFHAGFVESTADHSRLGTRFVLYYRIPEKKDFRDSISFLFVT